MTAILLDVTYFLYILFDRCDKQHLVSSLNCDVVYYLLKGHVNVIFYRSSVAGEVFEYSAQNHEGVVSLPGLGSIRLLFSASLVPKDLIGLACNSHTKVRSGNLKEYTTRKTLT